MNNWITISDTQLLPVVGDAVQGLLLLGWIVGKRHRSRLLQLVEQLFGRNFSRLELFRNPIGRALASR